MNRPNPYTSPDIREDIRVEVVGVHWGAYIEAGSLARQTAPTTCGVYSIPYDYFKESPTRDEVEEWLGMNSGDFEEVWDFSTPELEWKNEDSEVFFGEHS